MSTEEGEKKQRRMRVCKDMCDKIKRYDGEVAGGYILVCR
jgi:hypothetical protein